MTASPAGTTADSLQAIIDSIDDGKYDQRTAALNLAAARKAAAATAGETIACNIAARLLAATDFLLHHHTDNGHETAVAQVEKRRRVDQANLLRDILVEAIEVIQA